MADLTLGQARATWWSRQQLAGARSGALAQVIGDSGWLRTLGGGDVYIAARARRRGMQRSELDAAVEQGELRVMPAARGCIYLVPDSIAPDLMAFNFEAWHADTEKTLAKLGKKLAVVESFAPAVVQALASGPLTTDAIRKQIGTSIPSFGDAGKKVGLSSPLPLALRWLELRGQIERTLEGGRLDSERYAWRKLTGKPRASSKQPFVAIVEAFLGYAGPATVAQIATWSGRPQRDVKAALDSSAVVAVNVEELGEAWLMRRDLASAQAAKPPSGIALLAFEDNYLINHGVAVVADPRHHGIKIEIWGPSGAANTLGDASHVQSRTIVIDGLLAGFWEVDPRTGGAKWLTFDSQPKAKVEVIEDGTRALATFLLDEIGHARAYSLDSMELVQARADRLDKIKGGTVVTKPALSRGRKKTTRPPTKRSTARRS